MYGKATEDEIQFSRALGKMIGETTKRAQQPPSDYEHTKHQDGRFWLTICKDFFEQDGYKCQNEADPIKHAMSKLYQSQIASFAMTYRNKMTGELGHTKQEGYKLLDVFTEQAIRRLDLTHKAEQALWEKLNVW